MRRQRPEAAEPQVEEPSLREVLMMPRPSDYLWEWALDGHLRALISDLDALRGVLQLPAHRDDAFVHTLKVVDAIERTPTRRMAALLHDIGKGPTYIETPEGRSRFFDHDVVGAAMVPEIMEPLGAAEEEVLRVQKLVAMHMRPISYRSAWTDAAVRRLMDECAEGPGPDLWDDLLALALADLRGYLPEPIDRGLWVLEQLQAHRARLLAEEEREMSAPPEPRSPLDGNELVELAERAPGPWVGQIKDRLTELVALGELQSDDKEGARESAMEWLRRIDASPTGG